MQTLPSGYDVYSLVALTNNANVLYVWCSKRTVKSDGSYQPEKSDIFIDYMLVKERVQSEHGFLEDLEHKMMFVGAGPVGGNMTLNAFTWNDTTKKALSEQNIIKSFTNEDLGGYADIATALFFDESDEDNSNKPGFNLESPRGCNFGMFGVIGLALTALISLRNRKK